MAAALTHGSGHWVWDHDLGFHEYVTQEAGRIAGLAASLRDAVGHVPEQHAYRKLEDGRIWTKTINKFTSKEGKESIIDPSGKPDEGEHDVPVHGKMTGVARSQMEGDRLTTHITGSTKHPDGTVENLEYKIIREVKGEEHHLTLEDVTRGRHCTRVFRRYPYYRIANETGHTVTLSTYGKGDVVKLVPAMRVEIPVGTYFIDASSADTTEEQAVFTLPDGKKLMDHHLKAFETSTLRPENFH